MLSLRELQASFVDAVLRGSPAVEGAVRAGGLAASARIRIYRHAVLEGAAEALRSVYPVVHRLVGDRFFGFVAEGYALAVPSVSGDLEDYGGGLPAYLAGVERAGGLPYLPDVARLEWACHEVLRAPEAAPLEVPPVPAASHRGLGLRLHPAARLVSSEYPIVRIWEANRDQSAEPPLVSLGEGPVRAVVVRRGLAVAVRRLGPGEFALLQSLDARRGLVEACGHARDADPHLDLVAALQECLTGGLLVQRGRKR